MNPPSTKSSIKKYYETLEKFSDHQILFEGAVSTAFQSLLSDTAKKLGWTLIPQHRMKIAGQTIIPDGTLVDKLFIGPNGLDKNVKVLYDG